MKFFTTCKVFFILIVLSLVFSTIVQAQVNVVTQRNNLKRTGWMKNETILNQSNINKNSFGKIFSRSVDDQIYAQPLVVSNLTISGKQRNVVFVATVNNSLYAFDADDPTATSPLWVVNLTKTGYRPPRNTDITTSPCGTGYLDFSGNMGIVGTPVINIKNNTLYVVSRGISNDGSKNYVQYLHAIDIRTGAQKPNSPVFITATVNGSGDGSVNGKITFNQQTQNQRPGLLLYKGVVYIAWASHCDGDPYHGWVIGYDAKTLQQRYVYNNTANGKEAGIWMSGQAPAVDNNGFIYVSTGNGTVGLNGDPNNPVNRGESIVKLSTTSGNLQVADFFTPSNYQELEDGDVDYGSDGVVLIPNSSLSLSGSKAGILYLVNSNKMGHVTSDNSGAVQQIKVYTNGTNSGTKHIHGTPAYFSSPSGQEYIYVWSENGLLKQIPFNRSTMMFDTAKTILGLTILPQGMPGSMISISSNQKNTGTGVVWAVHPLQGNAVNAVVPGVLQAFDATNITRELWNSNMVPSRDSLGKLAKFVCPTIANGKVYMATFSNKLNVYGLIPTNKIVAKADTLTTSITSDAKLTISPNPAQRQLTIEYVDHKANASEKARLDIFGSTGNIIYHKDVIINNGGNLYLNITLPSNTQNGVYTVRIMNAKGAFKSQQLVISK